MAKEGSCLFRIGYLCIFYHTIPLLCPNTFFQITNLQIFIQVFFVGLMAASTGACFIFFFHTTNNNEKNYETSACGRKLSVLSSFNQSIGLRSKHLASEYVHVLGQGFPVSEIKMWTRIMDHMLLNSLNQILSISKVLCEAVYTLYYFPDLIIWSST